MGLVRGEPPRGDGGRAPALRRLRVSGPGRQSALGEASQGPAPGKRRLCFRIVHRRLPLDSRAAAALLAASVQMSEPFRRGKVRCSRWRWLKPRHMAYLEWGDERSSKIVVCVHGLTRCARDFDFLAQEIVRHGYRVICPDVAGRGDSDWLRNPMRYAVPTYARDMLAMIARLELESVCWVGTSLGGLIGMALAGLPSSPIKRLVLNDVG